MDSKDDLKLQLKQFYDDAENKTLIKKYLSETFFDIIGKAHSETVHSNFIEWYFKQHLWDSSAIKRMIGLAMINQICQESTYKNLISDFEKLKSCTVSGIEVKREYKCEVKTNKRKRTGYADIVISCELKFEKNVVPLKIIIENKVDSLDHDHQTFIYYTYFSNNESKCSRHGEEFMPCPRKTKYEPKKNEIQLFFFLSPSWNNGKIDYSCICDRFIRISYQDLYDYVVIPYIMQIPTETNKRRVLFVEEYRKNLIKPYKDKNNNLRIMAYDKKDIERLQTFWDTNLPLFKLAAMAICQETDDEETKERISSVIQSIDSIGKKYILYNLTLPNGEYHKNERMKIIAKRIVEYFLGKKIKIEEINTLLPEEIMPMIDTKDYEDKKRKSKDSRFDKKWDKLIKQNYYLSNQWTTTRFADFLSKLSNAYPEIRVEKANSLSED